MMKIDTLDEWKGRNLKGKAETKGNWNPSMATEAIYTLLIHSSLYNLQLAHTQRLSIDFSQ